MKVSSGYAPEMFRPVTITVTLESAAEVASLHAVFNHASIIDGVPNLNCRAIRDSISAIHPNADCAKTFTALNESLRRFR